MGDAVVFYSQEEREILKEIAKQEALKGNILNQIQSLHDTSMDTALNDVDLEIEELLKDLAAVREKNIQANAKRSLIMKPRQRK